MKYSSNFFNFTAKFKDYETELLQSLFVDFHATFLVCNGVMQDYERYSVGR